MVSFSNFGSDKGGSPEQAHQTVEFLHQNYPEMMIDGEMQVNFALNTELRDRKFPFNKLRGKDVNTFIFPNLSSANASYQLLQGITNAELIGPIQMGLNKPIHFTDNEAKVIDILNTIAIAVIDAMIEKNRQ